MFCCPHFFALVRYHITILNLKLWLVYRKTFSLSTQNFNPLSNPVSPDPSGFRSGTGRERCFPFWEGRMTFQARCRKNASFRRSVRGPRRFSSSHTAGNNIRPASSTNSLTATATPLCSVRTLPRRLHAQPPCISWKRRCRSAFATEEAASSTAAAIRAA